MTNLKQCNVVYGWPRDIVYIPSYLTQQQSILAHPVLFGWTSLKERYFAFIYEEFLSLFSNYLRRRARVVRSFSRFMLICLSTAVCMYNGGGAVAASWRRRRSGGALPPCNFILAPSFGFLPARGIRSGGVYEDGWHLSHQHLNIFFGGMVFCLQIFSDIV